MKVNYTAIILAAFLLIAATGRQILLLEPVAPTSTIILYECSTCTPYSNNLKEQAQPYLKQGYIVKLISIGGSGHRGYMVLEKY